MQEVLRQTLVWTAVEFLKNLKFKDSPLEEKKSFLLKKGLTPAEIEESIKISSIPSNLYPHSVSPPPPSTLSTITSSFYSLLLVAGSSYALYLFYQKYINPRLFGLPENSEKKLIQDLLTSSKQINTNLVSMVTTLNDLQQQIARTNTQLLMNGSSQEFCLATNEMREEIKSLKALLLSRNQFPSPPSTQIPSLPAWQIGTEQNKTTDSILNGDESGSDDDVGGSKDVV